MRGKLLLRKLGSYRVMSRDAVPLSARLVEFLSNEMRCLCLVGQSRELESLWNKFTNLAIIGTCDVKDIKKVLLAKYKSQGLKR